jgi:hypothetical protein
MSTNIIVVLMYDRYKLLDLTHRKILMIASFRVRNTMGLLPVNQMSSSFTIWHGVISDQIKKEK